MTCGACHKRKATVHVTTVIGDRQVETHLCQSCGKKKEPILFPKEPGGDFWKDWLDMSHYDVLVESQPGKRPSVQVVYKPTGMPVLQFQAEEGMSESSVKTRALKMLAQFHARVRASWRRRR
jgi:hypothetical protein